MEYSNNTVLLVDDEQAVMNALKRLLRPLKCKVLMSVSPIEALELLREHPVDVIISDMRMPEMGGEDFLEQVSEQYPDTERVVMTGYADTQATIDAINRGKISRFMLKPWDDEQVKNVVRKGFELAALKADNQRLLEETEQKNLELERLNASLEAKVQERTSQLKQLNDQLIGSYKSVARMFSTLTARRLGVKASALNEHLNQLLIGVAKHLGIKGIELKKLYFAWQLRNIGKLSFSDDILTTPYLKMLPVQQRTFHTHPLLAQAACMMVKPLYLSGKVILQSKEYMDGSGYPKGLKADEIDYTAQVICVMNDYVELINGFYDSRHYSTAEAIHFLQSQAAERYNQDVVAALQKMIEELALTRGAISDQCIQSADLQPGFKLSRDLISDAGILLLSAEQILDSTTINRIREMESNLSEKLAIYVTSDS